MKVTRSLTEEAPKANDGAKEEQRTGVGRGRRCMECIVTEADWRRVNSTTENRGNEQVRSASKASDCSRDGLEISTVRDKQGEK